MISQLLNQRKIVITCGTGGVGKTTLSATLALHAAITGKNAVVITVDPAKRLATSLGVPLGDEPTDLTDKLKKIYPNCKGKFSAIIPDTRSTFVNFIKGLADNQEQVERLLKNPIFEILAKEFSGANEYMALKKLHTIVHSKKFDFIVLDTPPSRNTMSFLEAPKLLSRFFEDRLIKWLLVPANKIFAYGMKKALTVLEGLTGSVFISNLLDFASALFAVRSPFTNNLQEVSDLISSDSTGFVVVSSPSPDSVDEIRHFIGNLKDRRLNFDGLFLNRTIGYFKISEAEWKEAEKDENLRNALNIVSAMQKRELQFENALSDDQLLIHRLPEFSRDIHTLQDLVEVAKCLESRTQSGRADRLSVNESSQHQ